jgi:hypothetical protein
MLKFITPLAIAALTVISIVPKSAAFPINLDSIFIGQSHGDDRPRVVVKIGGQPEYSNRWEGQRRQEELRREREREAEHRRHRNYAQRDRYSDNRGEYRRDR